MLLARFEELGEELLQLSERVLRRHLAVFEGLQNFVRSITDGKEVPLEVVSFKDSAGDRPTEVDHTVGVGRILLQSLEGRFIQRHRRQREADPRRIGQLPHELLGLPGDVVYGCPVLLESVLYDQEELAEPAVVFNVRAEERVRREDLVQRLDFVVDVDKTFAALRINEEVDHSLDRFVVGGPPAEGEVRFRLPFHEGREANLEDIYVLDHPADLVRVEGQRLLELFEDADEVHNQPGRLRWPTFNLVGAVHASDRLKERVVPHRLVEVHAVEDLGVETGQQLLRHDQDLRFLAGPEEGLSDGLLVLLCDPVLLEQLFVVVGRRVDDP